MRYEYIENHDFDGPDDEDYLIHSPANGPQTVAQGSRFLGSFDSEGLLCAAILEDMEAEKFWPNVWHVNERGSVDLCVIKQS